MPTVAPEANTSAPARAPYVVPPAVALTRRLLLKGIATPPTYDPLPVNREAYVVAIRTMANSWKTLLKNPKSITNTEAHYRVLRAYEAARATYRESLRYSRGNRECLYGPVSPSVARDLLAGGWMYDLGGIVWEGVKRHFYYPIPDVVMHQEFSPLGKSRTLWVNLGTFYIFYSPSSHILPIRMDPQTRRHGVDLAGRPCAAVPHPHVTGTGPICGGAANDLIRQRLANGELMAAIDALEGLLRTNNPVYNSFNLLNYVPPAWRAPLVRGTSVAEPLAPLPEYIRITNPDGTPWSPPIGAPSTVAPEGYTRTCVSCKCPTTYHLWERVTDKPPHKWACFRCMGHKCVVCGTPDRTKVVHCAKCYRQVCPKCYYQVRSGTETLYYCCSEDCAKTFTGYTVVPPTRTPAP